MKNKFIKKQMDNFKEKPFQAVLTGNGLLTVTGIVLWLFINNLSFRIISIVFVCLVYYGTYWTYRNQYCKKCFKLFCKEKMDVEEGTEIKKKPYAYCKIHFLYDDNKTEEDKSTRTTILRDVTYDKHNFKCKKCNDVSHDQKERFLDDEPKIEYIRRKGNKPTIMDGVAAGLETLNAVLNDEEYEYYNPKTKKKERKTIPKGVKTDLWIKHFGKEKANGLCPVCKKKKIHIREFTTAHIKAVADGGSDNISNLMPCCKKCNDSMGTMNLEKYKRKYYGNEAGRRGRTKKFKKRK